MTYDAPKINRPLIHILILFNIFSHNIKAVTRVVVAKDLRWVFMVVIPKIC